MATILDTLQKGTDYLTKHGVDEARLNMQHLLAHTLKCDRMQIYVDFDKELSDEQLSALRELTMKRAKGEPLQHLLGTSEFCGIEFKTDSRALIPRQETEQLTELASKLTMPPDPKILDMGCGSGVIGLSLARLLSEKNPRVILADVSPEALELARENRDQLGLADVELIQSDLFSNIEGQFDLVVANLPYISLAERTNLSREVTRDPELALYGGKKGTEIMARFFGEVGSYLKAGSHLAMEFGKGQEEEISAMAEQAGLENIRIVQDYSGIDRFLIV